MRHFSKQGIFPWFTLLAGLIGGVFQFWLLSAADKQGLLPKNHIAGILSFLLLAFTLGACLYVTKKAPPSKAYRRLFPPSKLAAVGAAFGAVGLGISAFTLDRTGLFQLLPVFGVASSAALLYSAYCRFMGLRPSFFAHVVTVIYLIFRTLARCRAWGAEPQLQLYFFQLLGSLFLLMACYFRAEMDILTGDYRKYLFCGQAALFCCCLCLPGQDRLFYLSAGIWMAADFCALPGGKSHA